MTQPDAALVRLRLEAAIALHMQGRLDQAEPMYEEILRAEPRHFDALQLLGTIAVQRKDSARAVGLFDQALAIDPSHANSLNNRGLALLDLARLEEALESFDRALGSQPDYAEAMINRGNALQALGRHESAVTDYDRALALRPDHPEALFNRANALCASDRHARALEDYERAFQQKPDHAEAMNNRGVALLHLERPDEALGCFDRALNSRENYWEALNNRGTSLIGLERYAEALQSLAAALALNPGYAEALINRGNALLGLERHEDALRAFDEALKVRPGFADAHYNRGNTLLGLRQYASALECFERALDLRPDFAIAMNNRGAALQGLNRLEDALESHERALELKPGYADAMTNRGIVSLGLGRYAQAEESFRRALEIKPDYEYLHGMWLQAKMKCCDWTDIEGAISGLVEKIERGEKASVPFSLLMTSGDPTVQRRAAEIWVRDRHPARAAPPQLDLRRDRRKIHVGYFSADFRNHPVSYLTAEMFEMHDRSRFELTGFSFGPDSEDDTRKRVAAAFDRFIDVRRKTDSQVASLSRELGVDIAVDLGGHTQDSRTGIFALRAAPLQASYLGYLGTMGAPYFDYLFADSTIIPQESQKYYAEKIAYLPSYQVNDTQRHIADRIFTRQELGLPESGFVFCCFNNNYKITPRTFSGWMRILGRVAGSVLFLYADSDSAMTNLRKEAKARGIDPARLVFGKRLPAAEYLARYRVADLFLDTLPYNAGTTASDALWTGLPVLTLCGETFSSRVAASLLHAIGLPDLIADSQDGYEALAVELATRPGKLAEIRTRLAINRISMPLFDTGLFTRHIEAAYTEMLRRSQRGLPAEHFHVQG